MRKYLFIILFVGVGFGQTIFPKAICPYDGAKMEQSFQYKNNKVLFRCNKDLSHEVWINKNELALTRMMTDLESNTNKYGVSSAEYIEIAMMLMSILSDSKSDADKNYIRSLKKLKKKRQRTLKKNEKKVPYESKVVSLNGIDNDWTSPVFITLEDGSQWQLLVKKKYIINERKYDNKYGILADFSELNKATANISVETEKKAKKRGHKHKGHWMDSDIQLISLDKRNYLNPIIEKKIKVTKANGLYSFYYKKSRWYIEPYDKIIKDIDLTLIGL